MSREQFTPDELKIASEIPGMFGGPGMPVYSAPITPKENMLRLYQGKTPLWTPTAFGDANRIMLDIDPENQARSPMNDGKPTPDGWGVEWIFVPIAGGAMVKPGDPLVKDIEEWEKYVKGIPDPDTWDWEGCAEKIKPTLNPDCPVYIAVPGCLFERLIALLDFENAAVALIDDEQKEAVHRLFRVITDIHKKTYTNAKKYLGADIVNFNDDWGSQRAEFFSTEVAREMFLPYIKELVDHVHSLGMYWDLHCCGFVEGLVPVFIEAGYDSWGGQPLNDKWKLKQMYGDKMIFTGHINCPKDATEEEQNAILREFFDTIGADNRVFVDVGFEFPEGFLDKVFETSRRNYDRLKAEGKAVD